MRWIAALLGNPAFLTTVAAAVVSWILKATISAGWVAVGEKLDNIATKAFVSTAIDNHRREVVKDIADLLASDQRQAEALAEVNRKHRENATRMDEFGKHLEALEKGQEKLAISHEEILRRLITILKKENNV